MTYPVTIITPTWNNTQYLQPFVQSLFAHTSPNGLFKLVVVNNGDPRSCDFLPKRDDLVVVQAGSNLGWEGGLIAGLEYAGDSEFVVFMNDDTYIPLASRFWLYNMISLFVDPTIGAVGPASNVVMGQQNIFASSSKSVFDVTFLIGYCIMVRRSALDKAGGVDASLPGGDDLDLSIRLRKAGYRLIVNKNAFVYHHGFKTGERLHGGSATAGGWNSWEMKEETDVALIRKHGFRAWVECITGVTRELPVGSGVIEDIEGEVIRSLIKGGKVYDLGCGARKTTPTAIGVDIVPKGQPILSVGNTFISAADVVADVSQLLPIGSGTADTVISRHILEHMIDPIQALKNWRKILKSDGVLILALPDDELFPSIPTNIEHKHAFTKGNIGSFMEAAGYRVDAIRDTGNGISFVVVAGRKHG